MSAFGQFTVYTTANSSLPSNDVKCVEGRNANVDWVGTANGLARITGTTWTIYNDANSGIPTNTASAVGVASNGNMYVGTYNGFSMFDGSTWTSLNSNVSTHTVYYVEVDNTDRVLASPYLGGLVVYNGVSWHQYRTADSDIPSNDVRAITVDNNGLIWVGTINGLASFNGTTWTVYNTTTSGLPSNVIKALAVAPDNTLWVATSAGLSSFSGTSWTANTTVNSSLPSNNINTMCFDGTGGLWVGFSDMGLARYNGSSWTGYTTSNSNLPSNGIYDLDINGSGALLIATQQGFAKLGNPTGIEELRAEGPSFSIRPDPAHGSTTIVLNSKHSTDATIRIFDMKGQPVTDVLHTRRSVEVDVDLSGLSSGSYIVRLTDASGTSVRPLIVTQ